MGQMQFVLARFRGIQIFWCPLSGPSQRSLQVSAQGSSVHFLQTTVRGVFGDDSAIILFCVKSFGNLWMISR
jgi:hypothetical protein